MIEGFLCELARGNDVLFCYGLQGLTLAQSLASACREVQKIVEVSISTVWLELCMRETVLNMRPDTYAD